MTPAEFKAWLEGYMLDRANPSAQVIAEKAATLQVYSLPIVTPGPYIPNPLRAGTPYTASAVVAQAKN